MIERIQLENFKSIKNVDLELKPINIFIGANGAGKSNFISFLEMMRNIIQERLQVYIAENGGIENLLHYGRKRSDYIRGLIDIYNTNAYFFTLKPSQKNSAYFEKEGDFFNTYDEKKKDYKKWNMKIWGEGNEETNIVKFVKVEKRVEKYRAKHLERYFNSYRVYHFHDTSKSSKIKQKCQINDNAELKEDGENLAAFLYYLQEKDEKSFATIESVIRLIAPFFDRFDLKPDRINEQVIQLEWKEKNSDMYLNAHGFSDGTLRMIALITLFLQPDPPKTIIIDEPELGLHPFAINVLASLIKKTSVKSQVIVSTQSINLIDNFSPEDLITVDRTDGQTQFKRLNSEDLKEWLDDYSLSDLWNKNVIGGRP